MSSQRSVVESVLHVEPGPGSRPASCRSRPEHLPLRRGECAEQTQPAEVELVPSGKQVLQKKLCSFVSQRSLSHSACLAASLAVG